MEVYMPDVQQIFDAYERRMNLMGRSKTALREFRRVTGDFAGYLRSTELELEDVNALVISEFFAQTGWSPATQHARLTYLRSPWNYARAELGMDLRDPFQWVALAPVPEREPKILTGRTLRAVKADLRDDENWALFHTFAYTGMRLMEVRGLRWTDVSFADQSATIIGKGNRERTIPLHPALQEALKRYGVFGRGSVYVFPGKNGAMMSHNGMWDKVKRMVRLRDISPHDFRRTVNTSLEQNEAREAAILQILWGRSAMKGNTRLEHYTALSQRVLFREILKLYADDPI